MDAEIKRKSGPLIRAVALLQLKLLLSAGRDLVLVPIALIAALIDLVQLKKQEPQHFRTVLRVGEKSDHWIDVWSHGRDEHLQPRENVDALLSRVEEVVRDREKGARQARVLKRWTERQLARAKQRATEEVTTRMKTLSDRKNTRDGE